MPPHVITLGEALVEIMRPADQPFLDRPGTFAGPFASGAPAIFAVAAARLGLSTGMIAALGQDAFGRQMLRRFADEGVDSSQCRLLPERATAVAFVAYTPSGDREFVFHIRHAAAGALSPDQVQSDYFTSVRCLHISGSTLALSAECRAACQRAVDLTRAAGGFVSFDPNLRPELMTVDAFRPIALDFCRQADLILPTASELIAITGQPDEDSALQHLLAETDALIAVKRGALGCTLVNRRERIDQPGFRVEEVDPTGAGDCFNAACVLGLLEGWPLAETARFAAAAGALAVTRQGPMEGAHDRAAVERFSHASG